MLALILAAASWNCNYLPHYPYVAETYALAQSEANNHDKAYEDYAIAVQIRQHCAAETNGYAFIEHEEWQAIDLIGESYEAARTDDHATQSDDLMASAVTLTHAIALMHMTPEQVKAWQAIRSILGARY